MNKGFTVLRDLVFIFIVMSIAFISSASATDGAQSRLLLFQGQILLAYYQDQYIEVKRLAAGSGVFYGFGWLDSDRVFVAYDPGEQGEAVAKMEVVDLGRSSRLTLKQIGGVGESYFDVNRSRGQVIYSTENAISLISLNSNTNEYYIFDIIKGVSCWAAFWVDDRTVGCKIYDKNADKMLFKKYPVPTLEQIKSDKGITKFELKWSKKPIEQD